jgi:hypothetical protein
MSDFGGEPKRPMTRRGIGGWELAFELAAGAGLRAAPAETTAV